MSWKEASVVSLREEFVMLAQAEGAKMTALCARFGISRQTGYKWLSRFEERGRGGLVDASRRPRSSPSKTALDMEEAIVALRRKHPAWGARKLRARLLALGHADVPAMSTVHAVLKRRGLIDAAEGTKHQAWQRFEHAAPNDLWQMDFKGHFALDRGGRCYPLTVLDDHSRFALALAACPHERDPVVRERLIGAFRRYGLPHRMLMDNGSPWGGNAEQPLTSLTVWLIRLGIGVSHGRPLHPQTQGKEERFHRTLKAEVLQWQSWSSLEECQDHFDRWRDVYNLERPHESLQMQVPAERYRTSPKPYPESLPEIEYGPGDIVRKVSIDGDIHFRGHRIKISKALRHQPVALRATREDGVWQACFCQHAIGQVALRAPRPGRVAVPTFVRYAHYSGNGEKERGS
jgi:transposase InsO family protein